MDMDGILVQRSLVHFMIAGKGRFLARPWFKKCLKQLLFHPPGWLLLGNEGLAHEYNGLSLEGGLHHGQDPNSAAQEHQGFHLARYG